MPSRRSFLVSLLCFACSTLACATSEDPLGPDGERSLSAPSAHAVDAARELVLARYERDGVSVQPSELQLRDLSSDGRGGARVRFALWRQGMPIDGGDIVVVLRANGRRTVVRGGVELSPAGIAPPTLDGPAADRAALDALAARASHVVLTVEPASRLVALPVAAGLVAAWRVVITGESDDHTLRREVYIDAHSGAVIHEREGLHAAAAHGSGVGVLGTRRELDIQRLSTGGYELRDDTRVARGIRTSSAAGLWRLPGRMVQSADPDLWDRDGDGAGAAVDAHAHAATTIDWLERDLGLDSWDGEGATVRLVVHYGQRLENAFWDGRRAVFGDGDGRSSRAFSAGLDVVAHEIFHGVIESHAELVYESEPGALNESLADVFGSLVEASAGRGNWHIGEAISDPPLRDLLVPSDLGFPDHMDAYLPLPPTPDDDMGGVHFNSTIPSHAAALLAEGGRHRLTGITVPRLGRAALRDIWWRALSVYLTPRARFADFARATLDAAEDLHGPHSPELAAVESAWRAVGVLP